MALKACIECKKQISTDANPCPNCGKKNPHVSPGVSLFVFLLVGIPMFAMCSGLCSKGDSSTGSSSAPKASAQDDPNCKQDLECWGDKNTVGAGVRCEEPIERLAKYAHEWTDGMLEPKMSHYRWQNRSAGVVTFIGDKLRFQNGFGAWQNVVYECDYDGKTVLDVRVHEGRL